MVATRTTDALKAVSQLPTEQLEIIAEMLASKTNAAIAGQSAAPPDLEALADLVAARTGEVMKGYAQPPTDRLDAIAAMIAKTSASLAARDAVPNAAPQLSDANLDEIEARMARLVEGFVARTPESAPPDESLSRVEQRLKQVEASLTRRSVERDTNTHGFETPEEIAAAPVFAAPAFAGSPPAVAEPIAEPPAPVAPAVAAAPAARAIDDSMPRDPSVDAPLKEFGFPDLGPVRAALEARTVPATHPIVAAPQVTEPPLGETPAAEPAPVQAVGPSFDPASVVPPPRPQSSFDREVDNAFAAPATPAAAPVEPLPASSRNTFIEAARRSAQRRPAAPTPSNPDSAIGRALSRFQSTKADKPVTPVVPEPAPIAAAEPVPAEPRKKPARAKLLSRKSKPVAVAPVPVPQTKASRPKRRRPSELPDMAAEVPSSAAGEAS